MGRRGWGPCRRYGRAMVELIDLTGPVPVVLRFADDSGLILLNLGHREEDGETGVVLATIRFCPFCGTEIQTDEDIEAALGEVEIVE